MQGLSGLNDLHPSRGQISFWGQPHAACEDRLRLSQARQSGLAADLAVGATAAAMAVVESTGRAISCLTGVPTASRICSCASPACPPGPSHFLAPGWGSAIASKSQQQHCGSKRQAVMHYRSIISLHSTACLTMRSKGIQIPVLMHAGKASGCRCDAGAFPTCSVVGGLALLSVRAGVRLGPARAARSARRRRGARTDASRPPTQRPPRSSPLHARWLPRAQCPAGISIAPRSEGF